MTSLTGCNSLHFPLKCASLQAGGRAHATVKDDVFTLHQKTVRITIDAHVGQAFTPLVMRPLLTMPAADLYHCSTDIWIPTLSLPENTAGKMNRLFEIGSPRPRDVHDIGTFGPSLVDAVDLMAAIVALNCHAENEPVVTSYGRNQRVLGGLKPNHLEDMIEQLRKSVEQKRRITYLPPLSVEETVTHLEARYARTVALADEVEHAILDDPHLRVLASKGAAAAELHCRHAEQRVKEAVEARAHIIDVPETLGQFNARSEGGGSKRLIR